MNWIARTRDRMTLSESARKTSPDRCSARTLPPMEEYERGRLAEIGWLTRGAARECHARRIDSGSHLTRTALFRQPFLRRAGTKKKSPDPCPAPLVALNHGGWKNLFWAGES